MRTRRGVYDTATTVLRRVNPFFPLMKGRNGWSSISGSHLHPDTLQEHDHASGACRTASGATMHRSGTLTGVPSPSTRVRSCRSPTSQRKCSSDSRRRRCPTRPPWSELHGTRTRQTISVASPATPNLRTRSSSHQTATEGVSNRRRVNLAEREGERGERVRGARACETRESDSRQS